MQKIIISLILFYKRIISPVLGNNCRFYPSCSSYAIESINKHGSLKGSWLSIKRICRCNPFCKSGIDYVPDKKSDAHDKLKHDKNINHVDNHSCCK